MGQKVEEAPVPQDKATKKKVGKSINNHNIKRTRVDYVA